MRRATAEEQKAYAADFALPGMLCGKVFRSAEAHARLVKLDTGKASRIPGVRAVITAADVADVRYGAAVKDEPVFASDIVRYRGQAVAAVAAISLEAAEAAIAAIEAVYEPLPPVFDLAAALGPGAPLVHEGWQSYVAIPILQRDGNVCNRARIICGDVERGWAEADRIFEHRFTTAMVHQGYTEPRAAVASWDSGQVTVWSNTQLPFDLQSTLAEILAIAPSKIRVIVPGVGGGFGGKLRVGVEHFAALLAKKAGRPVKIMTTGEEELTAAYPRQGTLIELKTGVTRDGRLTARQGRIYFDTGAFAGSGPGVASVATMVLAGPYRTPNLFLEGYAVYTNKTNCGSYRAPSGPQANFAVESQMDIIADALGIDPLELRLRNIVREGDEGPTGQVLTAVGLEECLLKVAEAIRWNDRRPAPGRGKGIACGWWTTTGGSSGVYVKINPDGTVALNTGAVEIGTGALTGAAQVLAEELGVDLTDISVVSADTFSTPFDFGAQGSRTAFAVGNACRAAAADLRRMLFAQALMGWSGGWLSDGSVSAIDTTDELRTAYTVFGIGFAAISVIFILLNAHALRLADRIGLNAGERIFTRMRRQDWCEQVGICLLSIALARWLPMWNVLEFSAPGMIYMLNAATGWISGRHYRREFARLSAPGA